MSDQPTGQLRRPGHMQSMEARSASFAARTRADDSWVEIASQPSSSSLSSAADDIITTGLRVQHDPRHNRRRRVLRLGTHRLGASEIPSSVGGISSQEEYEESESESDRVMTSSGEGPQLPRAKDTLLRDEDAENDDDDENRTAVNHPIRSQSGFTPQPNAFSHPPSGQMRSVSQPVPGSYFPAPDRLPSRQSTTHSVPVHNSSARPSHMPQNILSPSYNAAAHHDEALRASLSTLLSCAAAARGLKSETRRPQTTSTIPRSNRIEPMSIRLVPESALTGPSATTQLQEPTFRPTLRRGSTSTTSTSPERTKEAKRKVRSSSKERRSVKKARRLSASDEIFISPTLLTWVVSAGFVVVLSALSFSAGFSLGKEAGRLEAGNGYGAGDDMVRSCAREASRSSLGLKRSLARSAVQV